MKYKNRVRSRISNLKDAKNPNLRKNVLCGNIPPDLFARMTAEVSAFEQNISVTVFHDVKCKVCLNHEVLNKYYICNNYPNTLLYTLYTVYQTRT